jgi:hypothetical protein
MMTTVDAMAVLLPELDLRLMTATRLLAVVASMIPIGATTHPLTLMSTVMVDLPTIAHHQETTRPEEIQATETITAVATKVDFALPVKQLGPHTHNEDRLHLRKDTFVVRIWEKGHLEPATKKSVVSQRKQIRCG